MTSKRRSTNATPLNFRPSMSDVESKGTKPTREATTISEIFSFMVLFLCKKILFVDRKLRVIVYLGCLFLISLIKDAMTIPKWYFSRSDNVLNTVFVKFAWGWNLALIVPFLLLTSYIYCCGQKQRILKYHIPRVFIATFFWWFWVKMFNIVEASYGRCTVKGFVSKETCLLAGYVWNGFDISGHSFILIYGSLVLIEEANCMIQWDSIKDYLLLEEYNKKIISDSTINNNPLKNLSDEEFVNLQKNYSKYTPYIRLLFIAITCLQMIWDFMLFTTMLYYHVMVEKLLGGIIAICTWFLTYIIWFRYPTLLPGLPGEGVFKYIKTQVNKEHFPTARRGVGSFSNNQGPTFMGRPIYQQNQDLHYEGEVSR